MHTFATLAAAALLATSAGGSAHAVTQPVPRKATLAAPRQSVCSGGRLLSHAAYLPTATGGVTQCGHLLSTDTLLTVHRWDKT